MPPPPFPISPLVGFDTSTPELVTSVKGAPGIAYGNVIGSNIYDILGIAGVTAMVSPGPVATEILGFDNLVMTAASLVVVVVVLVWTGPRTSRREGALLLAGYGLYLWALWS